MQLFVLISYLIVVVALGFSGKKSTKRRDTTNYLLAGRKLSLPGFVVTLVSTWYGGIIGIGENTYLYGFQTWTIFGLPYYIFAIIFAFFVDPRHSSQSAILAKPISKIPQDIIYFLDLGENPAAKVTVFAIRVGKT